ncbi:MAG: hypothetical protein FWF38_08080 [Spirochaetaceae bacterium]|nr:hypothetical protein [Spirochaetaceae bacterium]
MKKFFKLFGIAATVTIFLFMAIACDNSSSSGGGGSIALPPAGDGSISFASVKTYDVYLYSNWNTLYTGSPITFTRFVDEYASYISAITDNPEEWEVKIDGTPRKLYLKLGTPKASVLKNVSSKYPSLTCTSGLKIFESGGFQDGANLIFWDKRNLEDEVDFLYADRNGTISGSFYDSYEKLTFLVNMSLKQGWNTVTRTFNGSTVTNVTGTPDSSFKWILESY